MPENFRSSKLYYFSILCNINFIFTYLKIHLFLNTMKPKKIEIIEKNLVIKWEDENISNISLIYLRNECPCAGCKGETVLLKAYKPPKIEKATPNMFKIKNIKIVGGYAIQILWLDGHNTGIYSWEYLKDLEKGQSKNSPQNYNELL